MERHAQHENLFELQFQRKLIQLEFYLQLVKLELVKRHRHPIFNEQHQLAERPEHG